jgi:hypothetical protein
MPHAPRCIITHLTMLCCVLAPSHCPPQLAGGERRDVLAEVLIPSHGGPSTDHTILGAVCAFVRPTTSGAAAPGVRVHSPSVSLASLLQSRRHPHTPTQSRHS